MTLSEVTYRASFTAAQMKAAGTGARVRSANLRDDLSLLSGAGGNILILQGTDGSLAVDSGLCTARKQLTTALADLAVEPLRYLVNTHWHFDHTGGNEWMNRAGAAIIAHESSRARMKQTLEIPAFDVTVPPSPPFALPTILFAERQAIEANGEVVLLRRYTPAHTDTDISVLFSRANVLHTGDTWFNGAYPFIDYDSGGSIRGLLAAATENLSLADRGTIAVPGHGDVGTWDDLDAFRDMLLAVCDRVAALKTSGASAEEVIAAKPTSQFDSKWASGFVPPELFTWLVYRGL